MSKPGDDKREDLAFDPRHVETFLTKIRADRDEAIQEIRGCAEQEIAKIRKDAYRAARALARKTIKSAREQEALERDRFLYKIKSELKREHWKVLESLRQEVLRRARETFEAAWAQPAQQWAWCESWLNTATELAQGQVLSIRLGQGGSDKITAKIKHKLKDYSGEWSAEIDQAAPAGVVIAWPDHLLDGTLISHCEDVSREVVNQLAQTLSPAQSQEHSE